MSYYVLSTNKLRKFLIKIQSERKPDDASIKWLKGLGFTASNDTQFLQVMETIGFLDSGRKPTERWRRFQDTTQSGKIMAEALVDGYSVLYKTFKDAHEKSSDELIQKFKIELEVSENIAKLASRTFKTLVDFADFDALEEAPPKKEEHRGGMNLSKPVFTAEQLKQLQAGMLSKEKRELAVNINIQITLPEKGEPEDYDKIFAALKKHFFSE